jgi:hypothetical protein
MLIEIKRDSVKRVPKSIVTRYASSSTTDELFSA